MAILILGILIIVCIFQAIFASMINRGGPKIYGILMFVLGLAVSYLWVLLSRYSTNLLRDGLIWDVLIAAIFTVIFIIMGHAQHFTLKHWIAVAMTIGVFIYWGLLK